MLRIITNGSFRIGLKDQGLIANISNNKLPYGQVANEPFPVLLKEADDLPSHLGVYWRGTSISKLVSCTPAEKYGQLTTTLLVGGYNASENF